MMVTTEHSRLTIPVGILEIEDHDTRAIHYEVTLRCYAKSVRLQCAPGKPCTWLKPPTLEDVLSAVADTQDHSAMFRFMETKLVIAKKALQAIAKKALQAIAKKALQAIANPDVQTIQELLTIAREALDKIEET